MAKLFILWDISDSVTILELLLMTEEDPGIAYVLEDVLHAGVGPEVLPNILCMLTIELSLKLCGRPSLFRVQQAGDRHEPHAAEIQLIDAADCVRSLGYRLDIASVLSFQ